jgi:hypothetical protein
MAERQEIKSKLREYLPKKKGPLRMGRFVNKLDVVLTTFSYFSSEKSDDRNFLRKFDWNYVSLRKMNSVLHVHVRVYRKTTQFVLLTIFASITSLSNSK